MDFTKYYGEIKKDEILLWSSSYWLRFNYPIFVLKFNEDNILEGIRLEKNPLNKVLGKLLLLVTGSFIVFFATILQLKAAIIIILVLIVFSLFFYLLLINQINFEKRNMTLDLKKDIYSIERKGNPSLAAPPESEIDSSKEWTLAKILLRVILYPFCLGLIYISITMILPSDKPFYALLGIGVGLSYLVADLRISFKKFQPAKNKNNKP
ncbi:hypothetical protein [Salegentibacter sp. F14]